MDSRMPAPVTIRKRFLWCILMGILMNVLGIFLIAYPAATATITTLILGWALIFIGITQFVFALHSEFAGGFFAKALLGVLYGITGLALMLFPFGGVAALTAMIGTLLIVHAGLTTITAFQARSRDCGDCFLFDAMASLCVGLLIILRWPFSSVWAIATLVGVAVLISGISRITVAMNIRRETTASVETIGSRSKGFRCAMEAGQLLPHLRSRKRR